jgi:hypothetical protein
MAYRAQYTRCVRARVCVAYARARNCACSWRLSHPNTSLVCKSTQLRRLLLQTHTKRMQQPQPKVKTRAKTYTSPIHVSFRNVRASPSLACENLACSSNWWPCSPASAASRWAQATTARAASSRSTEFIGWPGV